jgi:hypothetical protein
MIERKFLGSFILDRVLPIWSIDANVLNWIFRGRHWWVHLDVDNGYFCVRNKEGFVVEVSQGICWRESLVSGKVLEEQGFDVFREKFEKEVEVFLCGVFNAYRRVDWNLRIFVGEVEEELRGLSEKLGLPLFEFCLRKDVAHCFCNFPDLIGIFLDSSSEYAFGDGYYFLFKELKSSKLLCELLSKWMIALSELIGRNCDRSKKRWGIRWKLGEKEYALVCDGYSAAFVEFLFGHNYFHTLISVSHGHISSMGSLLGDGAFVDFSLIPVREYWGRLKEVLNSLIEFLSKDKGGV